MKKLTLFCFTLISNQALAETPSERQPVVQCGGVWQNIPCHNEKSEPDPSSDLNREEITKEALLKKMLEERELLEKTTSFYPAELDEALLSCQEIQASVQFCLKKLVQAEKSFTTRIKTLISAKNAQARIDLEKEKVSLLKKKSLKQRNYSDSQNSGPK